MRVVLLERRDHEVSKGMHGDEVRCSACDALIEADSKACKRCGCSFGGGATMKGEDIEKAVGAEAVNKAFGRVEGVGAVFEAENRRRAEAWERRRLHVVNGGAPVAKSSGAGAALVATADAMVRDFPGLTHGEAMDRIMKSDAGRELYAKHRREMLAG